jgi:hypothetical protein
VECDIQTSTISEIGADSVCPLEHFGFVDEAEHVITRHAKYQFSQEHRFTFVSFNADGVLYVFQKRCLMF